MSDEEDEWRQWGSLTAFRIGRDDLAALGTMIVATQQLENLVANSIAALLGAIDDVDALTSDLAFRMKIQILGAMVLRRINGDDAAVARWKVMESGLNEARDDRNHFVHAMWDGATWSGRMPEYVEKLKAIKFRARKDPVIRPAEKATLHNMACRAEQLSNDLWRFIRQISPEAFE